MSKKASIVSSLHPALAWALVAAAGAGAACSGAGEAEPVVVAKSQLTVVTPFSVITPTGSPQSTIMSASSSLTIDDRVTIGAVGQPLEIVGTFGTPTTALAAGVKVYANTTSKGPVTMGSNGRVFGFLKSGGSIVKQQGAQVLGGETQHASITGVPTQWDVTFPDTNAGEVFLDLDQDRTLDPGSWGNVTMRTGSRLFLRSGTYYFQSVLTEPNGRIFLDKTNGPIFIYVKDSYSIKGAFVSNGGPEASVFVGYLGTTIAYIESPLLGTIVAPNATVELRRPANNAAHRGAVFGKNVHVFSDVTVLRLPFPSWSTVLCPLGDRDGDGVSDCTDLCPLDPAKTTPGQCRCGTPDTDNDDDKVANCLDQCPNDPTNTVRGQCGCAGEDALPPNTPCTDHDCPLSAGATQATCNGAGVCGSRTTCAPSPGCKMVRFESRRYWFCPGPVTWTQAVQNCRAIPNRTLVRINTLLENDVLRASVTGTWWTGANAQSVPGTWRWASPTTNNGDTFWSAGAPVSNRFARWAPGQPDTSQVCAAIGPNGEWTAKSCASTGGYICEDTPPMTPPPPPPLDCSKFFPASVCQPTTDPPPTGAGGAGGGGGTPTCVPASTVFGDGGTTQAFDQIAACNAAGEDGTCTATNSAGCAAACQGAAAVPPADATCPPFEDEERAFCALVNPVETGCTADEDCCGFTKTLFVSGGDNEVIGPLPEGFTNSTAGFAYVDDAFQGAGAAAPAYANGTRVTTGGNPGAALQVMLGGINNTAITNMSGGWQFTFNLAQEGLMVLSFEYNLSQTPNYEPEELSQVLVTVDGQRRGVPFNEHVDQVIGNGEGGANVTTGWRTFTRNLGVLPAGVHVLRVGGFNNQKTNVNESTTLLIDNVILQARVSTCPAGYLCGPMYQGGCDPCAVKDDAGKCINDCGEAVLRCGQPITQTTPTDGIANCADNSLFVDQARCQQIELCSDPDATGTSDPTTGGQLAASPPLQPSQLGAAAGTVPQFYAPDDCINGCTPGQGGGHPWCQYGVTNNTPDRAPPAESKTGDAGSALVSFSFSPDVHFNLTNTPLPFGDSAFTLDAGASLAAGVHFDLGGPVRGDVSIVDAALVLHGTRCHLTDMGSRLDIFDHGFFPQEFLFTTGDPGTCEAAQTAYELAVKKTKKAFRDAIELVRQYKDHVAQNRPFPASFCTDLVGETPPGFPPGSCPAAPDAVVNRFIAHYRDEVGRLRVAFQNFKDALTVEATIPAKRPDPERDTEVIFQATFPIGPIPLLLQVEAFAEYGMEGSATFSLHPADEQGTGSFQSIASITGRATPYALAGLILFVGIGFEVNGFEVSAGVEGAITLGRIGLDAHAGIGFGVRTTPDTRQLPADVLVATAPGVLDASKALFPVGGAKRYNFALGYDYGMSLDLDQILAGTISARLRVRFFFFSKTWRKVLMRFPGFGLPEPIPLVSGGGNLANLTEDPLEWGVVQMPLAFVDLANVQPAVITGTAVLPFDPSRVDKVHYDSQCACQPNGNPCTWDGGCCDPASVCFSDPDGVPPAGKVCSGCRQPGPTPGTPGDSCNVDKDCCNNPSNYCNTDGNCQCSMQGQPCTGPSTVNCCPELNARWCEVSARGAPGVTVCKSCRDGEDPCTGPGECCEGYSCVLEAGKRLCKEDPI